MNSWAPNLCGTAALEEMVAGTFSTATSEADAVAEGDAATSKAVGSGAAVVTAKAIGSGTASVRAKCGT